MPPRKRKAVANSKLRPVRELSPINENACPTGHDPGQLKEASQIQCVELLDQAFASLESRAQEQCHEIISAAGKAARALELDFESQLKRLSKVREQRIAALLELSSEEASGTDLGPILKKLLAVLQPDPEPIDKEACRPTAEQESSRDAPADPCMTDLVERQPPGPTAGTVEEEDDVRAAQLQDQRQSEAAGTCPQGPAAAGKSPKQAPRRRAAAGASATVDSVLTLTASTPGPPGPPVRAGRGGRRAAPAAPIPSAAATPAAAALGSRRVTRQAAAASETPVAARGTLELATAPGSASFGSFTLMTRTAVGTERGKTRRRAIENVITINTADGQQFQIDGEQGLEGVPETSRAEVAQQLEVMQRLVAAALMKR